MTTYASFCNVGTSDFCGLGIAVRLEHKAGEVFNVL